MKVIGASNMPAVVATMAEIAQMAANMRLTGMPM